MEGRDAIRRCVSGLFMAARPAPAPAPSHVHDSALPLAASSPVQHAARRDQPGASGRGCTDARDRAILAVFIAASWWAGRGVPRQEGRELRDQDGDDHRVVLGEHPRLHRPRVRAAEGLAGPLNKGPHGFSEILTPTRARRQQRSAFAGLSGHAFYNVTGAIAMLIALRDDRPILALAGPWAKRRVAPSRHVPDDRRPVTVLLVGVVIIVGALTFFRPLAWPDRRAAAPERRKGLLIP